VKYARLLALSGHGHVLRTDGIRFIAAFYSPFAACDATSIRGQINYSPYLFAGEWWNEKKKCRGLFGAPHSHGQMCPERDLNRAPPNFNPTALPLHKSARSAVTHCRVPFQFHPKQTLFFGNEALSFSGSQRFSFIRTNPPTEICSPFIHTSIACWLCETHVQYNQSPLHFYYGYWETVNAAKSFRSFKDRPPRQWNATFLWLTYTHSETDLHFFPQSFPHKPVLFPLQVSNNTNDHFPMIYLQWIVKWRVPTRESTTSKCCIFNLSTRFDIRSSSGQQYKIHK